ncbi:two-component system sensor histidine kinase KdpD [Noviherbaspirillum sp.]|uniref:two-component system sensor histidine kinase KdpD n=1 Tax=Noviherbaspirillum sp. TaxID=1926288 RepID=UPI002B47AED9|nr:two-component system sensor histidine kinase KdpD [Noviherbaspirillum sp.]HJV79354.1 two-component system sensor histidine kinase KdpD [Noviherbaspirillum sp.]
MDPTEFQRPNPDTLLARVQEQERRAARGKLRIYFGASAGVGKTYAMLLGARDIKESGKDVVVGIVETHGRSETNALLDGLEVLPRKTIDYRGRTLTEFDIDAALARRPALILVDELAHSNAPGSRHPKRWQDIEELLSAGMDVFTTVNVQHLESLNDAVGGITGVRVAETVPDTVFNQADEVVLVDIPAEELLLRLKAGKVYQEAQAERASQNFFRKGNLIALRELALRRTAERIETDVLAYRVEKAIGAIWKTDADLLVCVGSNANAEQVIRSGARLASQLSGRWHAVYVETPQLQRLPSAQRERILNALKLAQELGANTAVLASGDVALEIARYARSHNFSRVVLGRSRAGWPWKPTLGARLARYAPELDLVETSRVAQLERAASPATNPMEPEEENVWPGYARAHPYLWTVGASIFTTLVATPMAGYFELANIVMLYLLNVVLVGVRLGRRPAVLSAFLCVALFDFFFVPPRFTFAISDFQYLVVFAVMLAVGLIAGQITAGLQFQSRIASHREERARALYEFARDLSGALQAEQIFGITQLFIQQTFRTRAVLLLPDADGRLRPPSSVPHERQQPAPFGVLDLGIAQWAFDHGTAAGIGTDTLPGSRFFYLPLVAPMRTRGVLVIEPENRRWLLIPEQRRHLDTFATLAAIALERVHYIEVAQDVLLRMESERLRNSLLSALSHDLRTPLTSLVGFSETLATANPSLPKPYQELASALHDEAVRMSKLVTNLLDMARLQSGEIRLNRQWQPFEEVVGSALRASRAALAAHTVEVRLAPGLPLVHIDAVLIERVLCNLIENAAKYTPAQCRIALTAATQGNVLRVSIIDNGPGIPVGREEAIFEKFTRGEHESAKSGVGLGLAICRAIVEAHDGEIHAERPTEGGAAFIFTLPLGTPPAMPDVEPVPIEHEVPRDS